LLHRQERKEREHFATNLFIISMRKQPDHFVLVWDSKSEKNYGGEIRLSNTFPSEFQAPLILYDTALEHLFFCFAKIEGNRRGVWIIGP
jgi:hypothetical protein